MKTTIYIEGGGKTKQLHSELRHGFKTLFEKVGFSDKLPKVVACGSRNDAFRDFTIAFKKKKEDDLVLLLVDSEELISSSSKWEHVKNRDSWNKPLTADEENIFFIVICMESWFLADKDGLKKFFGTGFNAGRLPQTTSLESIDKTTLYDGLKKATKNTRQHSFKILTYLDACKVENHGEYSKEFFEYLRNEL